MISVKRNEDIALSTADAIVNASNGMGYMGGQWAIQTRRKGVAESIQYISSGEVEKLSRDACRQHSIFGYRPGNVFVTAAPNLQTKIVIHAVTMRLPGSKSKLKYIEQLLPKIVTLAENMNLKTVAIPLLGCGTGRLSEEIVYSLFETQLINSRINFIVYRK